MSLIDKILKESAAYPNIVYHFTTPSALVEILKTNIITKGRNGTISFTTDNELWAFRGPHEDELDEIAIRIAFNTNTLPKLEEYDDSNQFDDLSHEKEFCCKVSFNISNKISNITAFNYCKKYLENNLSSDMINKISWE